MFNADQGEVSVPVLSAGKTCFVLLYVSVELSWFLDVDDHCIYRKVPKVSGALTFEISSPWGRLVSGSAYFWIQNSVSKTGKTKQ